MDNLPRIGAIVHAAVSEWAEKVAKDVIKDYPQNPLTPVLTGALRSAGSVFVNGEYIKRTPKRLTGRRKPAGRKRLYFPPARKLPASVKRFKNSITVDWVVNTPYAPDPRFPQQPPRGPNYLRVPIVVATFTNMQSAPKFITKRIKRLLV